MKYLVPAIRLKLFMTLLLGLAYPMMMTGLAKLFFPQSSQGEFLSRDGQLVGAKLIGQKFQKAENFWSRPSAVDYNPLPSGGSNLGQASSDLKQSFEERKRKLKLAHPEQTMDPPQDLLFASASGLDPHISVEAAKYQLHRVAIARGMSEEYLKKLIDQATEKKQWGILGEETVNVLALNLSLDRK